MPQFAGSINRYPARASLTWYGVLLVLGTATLALAPQCWADPERPITLLDALFTTTSACCVTGLAVRSTVGDFSPLGQAVILLLIQLGGIGIMTVTTLIVVQFDKRGSLRRRKAIADTLGARDSTDVGSVLRMVVAMTLWIETVGFLILAVYHQLWYDHYAALGVWSSRLGALWHALFNSVSAFNNAGFALCDASLVPFADSWVVNLTICTQIVLGGLGYPVLADLWRTRTRRGRDRWTDLMLHTKIMLIGTAVLLVVGAVAFLSLEWDGVLRDRPIAERALASAFHSVTCRTAGFNTVDVGDLSDATLFVTMLLMLVGAGPCSTAGGFKVTTASLIILRAWATFQGFARVNLFRRTIPPAAVERAIATAMLFVAIAGAALTTLLVVEQSYGGVERRDNLFLEGAFEVVSALGTVGLSMGLTTSLSEPGRLVIILLMLLGRLGPISTFVALSHSERSEQVEFLNQEPLVG